MRQNPRWEPDWFAANQEFPQIFWNPKFRYRFYKRRPRVSKMSVCITDSVVKYVIKN
jgi:hypothetical protein